MTNKSLISEMNKLPKELRADFANFVEFLKSKSKIKSNLKVREYGFAKGKIKFSSDFDEPLDEFMNYL